MLCLCERRDGEYFIGDPFVDGISKVWIRENRDQVGHYFQDLKHVWHIKTDTAEVCFINEQEIVELLRPCVDKHGNKVKIGDTIVAIVDYDDTDLLVGKVVEINEYYITIENRNNLNFTRTIQDIANYWQIVT